MAAISYNKLNRMASKAKAIAGYERTDRMAAKIMLMD
jgi:hypothetical protein